ncbi:MAG: AbgT family transporter [Planctomycetes bacterium]|nr:AbgT family transporter [Planctomycetota bacterium]
MDRFLSIVERGGNALPHPATLFLILGLLTLVASKIAAATGLTATLPGKEEVVAPVDFLTVDGLHRILLGLITNFTGFAPLGTVLVALLGIGVAEHSGLIGTCMRLIVSKSPRSLLTMIVVFAGVVSNAASEIGYVLLVPLGAVIFHAAGRHPLLGLAAAFAGVSGGYSANLVIGTVDPLLQGLTQEAAQIMEEGREVSVLCNYYFMIVSTFLVTALGTWVTEKIVAPRLGDYDDSGTEHHAEELRDLSGGERRGLVWAGIAFAICAAICIWGLLPDSFLTNPETGGIMKSPFIKGIVSIVFIVGAICGIAYGAGAGTIKNDSDVMRGMGRSMETLGGYIVLVFFAAQFVAWFKDSNLGLIVAVKGASGLEHLGIKGIPLLLAFVLLSAFINLFMGSASAKWAIMAPVFVPMFMLLGYEPELTQVAYRIGDSCTNIISPLMSQFALIISFFQRYDKKAGIGTLVATMLPYTIVFLIGWCIMLVVWVELGLPLGPGAPV